MQMWGGNGEKKGREKKGGGGAVSEIYIEGGGEGK